MLKLALVGLAELVRARLIGEENQIDLKFLHVLPSLLLMFSRVLSDCQVVLDPKKKMF